MNTDIRLLTADEIDVRIAQTKKNSNGVIKADLLLYKDARCDMRILDEVFTPFGWRRCHKEIGGRLYCQVDIWDAEKKEWISKEDVGTESNTEAEKGQASDSFKRACFNWGIGRELYTAPKIKVELNEKETWAKNNGSIGVYTTFSVAEIGYDEKRNINKLTIVDGDGTIRYSLGASVVKPITNNVSNERKKGTRKKTQPLDLEPYSPVDDTTYWKMVRNYANGVPPKSGNGTYRELWIQMTHASEEIQAKFDDDVANYLFSKQQDAQANLRAEAQRYAEMTQNNNF